MLIFAVALFKKVVIFFTFGAGSNIIFTFYLQNIQCFRVFLKTGYVTLLLNHPLFSETSILIYIR